MSAVPAVVLILGAGANVGQSAAQAFAAKGYKVAVTARRLKETDSTAGQLNVPADLSDPKAVVDVFTTVQAKLGIPSVVIYNGEHPRLSSRNPP